MAIGYAAFNAELKISGTSKVTSNWDIEITNVTSGTPVGGAENTVAPKWDALTASMEADLYEKGDAMEYDVTIENKGTIDAKLNDVLTNIENANSEAINITFSGYTKGEILKAKSIKVIHVKIEYNPNYEGEETSSEVEINFDYTQENKDPEAPKSYLLTYDYSSNGGTNVDIKEEYVTSKTKVNLNNNAYKEGYTFVGWNTDRNAKKGLTEYEMPESSVTLYAIYSKEIKVTYTVGNNITNISKTNDTCSMYNNETSCEITLPNITPNNGYMIDGWYNGNSKIGNPNDKYKINNDITLSSKAVEDIVSLSISTTMTTNSITVVANASATSGINKYEYSKDGGKTWVVGTGNTHIFTGLTQGTSYNIMARITSNTGKQTTANKTATTTTISKPTFSESGTTPKTVTITYPNGCGSTLTCTYQKDNGNIVTVKSTTASVEFTASGSVVAKITDGTNTVSSSYTVSETTASQILKQSEIVTSGDGLYKDTYEDGRYFFKGTNPNNYITFNEEKAGWRIISIEKDGTIKIMRIIGIGEMKWNTSGAGTNSWVNPEASLNSYLNQTYYNRLNINSQKQIVTHQFSIGSVEPDNNNLSEQIKSENSTTWEGKIALPTVSEYLRTFSSAYESRCSKLISLKNNTSLCRMNNWMYIGSNWWTLSPFEESTEYVYYLDDYGANFNYEVYFFEYEVRPTIYLNSELNLAGTGTEDDPYRITN